MKNKYKIVNPSEQKPYYKMERRFLSYINRFGIKGLKALSSPLRYFPNRTFLKNKTFFEYELRDNGVVFCYFVDSSWFIDNYNEYSLSPFSKADFVHAFKIAQIN